MAIQIQADEIIEIIRSRTRVCNLSNLCIYATDTNDRMARTRKIDII